MDHTPFEFPEEDASGDGADAALSLLIAQVTFALARSECAIHLAEQILRMQGFPASQIAELRAGLKERTLARCREMTRQTADEDPHTASMIWRMIEKMAEGLDREFGGS